MDLRWAKLKLQKYTTSTAPPPPQSHLPGIFLLIWGSLFDSNVLTWVWFQLAFTVFTTGWASIWGVNYCGSPCCDSTALGPCGWRHHQPSVIRNKKKSFLSGRPRFSLTFFFFFWGHGVKLWSSSSSSQEKADAPSRKSSNWIKEPHVSPRWASTKCCRNTFTAPIGYIWVSFRLSLAVDVCATQVWIVNIFPRVPRKTQLGPILFLWLGRVSIPAQ